MRVLRPALKALKGVTVCDGGKSISDTEDREGKGVVFLLVLFDARHTQEMSRPK